MDVENIQKINNLALDLMKQGLAANRDEAIAQAEKVLKERETENYAEIRERMQETQKEESKETSEDLSPEKVKAILEQNTRFIASKFKEFQEKLEMMEREISFVKNKAISNGPTVKEIVSQEKENKATQERTAAPSAEEETKNDQENNQHPRSGGYNEEDVSIEKFFYMGNK